MSSLVSSELRSASFSSASLRLIASECSWTRRSLDGRRRWSCESEPDLSSSHLSCGSQTLIQGPLLLSPSGILAGVPTNAQLTLRLLRDAESRLQPLPPPPPPEPTDDEVAAQLEAEEEEDELDSDPPTDVSSPSDDFAFVDGASTSSSPTKEEKIKVEKEKIKGSGKIKLANFIKSTARLTEEGAGYLSGTKRVDWEKVSKARLCSTEQRSDRPLTLTCLAGAVAPLGDARQAQHLPRRPRHARPPFHRA